MQADAAFNLNLPVCYLVIRGTLAGVYLGVAISMAVGVAVAAGLWVAGALLFPFGLALAILHGCRFSLGVSL